jgi:hypothetical protein
MGSIDSTEQAIVGGFHRELGKRNSPSVCTNG